MNTILSEAKTLIKTCERMSLKLRRTKSEQSTSGPGLGSITILMMSGPKDGLY